MGVIYLLTFSNGKQYVGQTREKNPSRRFARHAQDAARGINRPVSDAWKILGKPLIEILGAYPNSKLNEKEIESIGRLNTVVPHGYNLSNGGSAKATHETTKDKIRKTVAKLWADPVYAAHMSAAHRGKTANNRGARHAAKVAGALTYFGSRCSNNHIGKRYTSTGTCCDCLAARPSAYIRVGSRRDPRQLKLLP
jgi:GIY-YIG catalytic domain